MLGFRHKLESLIFNNCFETHLYRMKFANNIEWNLLTKTWKESLFQQPTRKSPDCHVTPVLMTCACMTYKWMTATKYSYEYLMSRHLTIHVWQGYSSWLCSIWSYVLTESHTYIMYCFHEMQPGECLIRKKLDIVGMDQNVWLQCQAGFTHIYTVLLLFTETCSDFSSPPELFEILVSKESSYFSQYLWEILQLNMLCLKDFSKVTKLSLHSKPQATTADEIAWHIQKVCLI